MKCSRLIALTPTACRNTFSTEADTHSQESDTTPSDTSQHSVPNETGSIDQVG